ncbi:hypothetical protein AB0756_39865 [Tolypothrix campylonemoides VB511288_2]|uniref:Uncharacterized protein n=2 Tax=Nostocales TaxID=1161 RepID=A0ABW8X133_9CYAN
MNNNSQLRQALAELRLEIIESYKILNAYAEKLHSEFKAELEAIKAEEKKSA